MTTANRLIALAAAAALAAGVAACGGDDAPETSIPAIATDPTETLSKSEFIDELDSVCLTVNAQIEEFAANGEGISAATEIAQLRQGILDEIEDVGPPEQDRVTLDDFVTAYENVVVAGRKIGAAVKSGGDTVQPEADLEAARAEAETAATEYGFKNCGQPVDTSATPGVGEPSDGGGTVAPAPAPAPAPPSGGGDTGGGDGGGGIGVG